MTHKYWPMVRRWSSEDQNHKTQVPSQGFAFFLYKQEYWTVELFIQSNIEDNIRFSNYFSEMSLDKTWYPSDIVHPFNFPR